MTEEVFINLRGEDLVISVDGGSLNVFDSRNADAVLAAADDASEAAGNATIAAAEAEAAALAAVAATVNKANRDLGNLTFSAPAGPTPGGQKAVRVSLNQFEATPEDYLAAGNGLTDDAPKIALADALALGVVLGQNYFIDTDITIASQVRFVGNGRLTIASGKIVTFLRQPEAADRQIFFGGGDVAGLSLSRVVWFAGDGAGNIAVDSQPRFQKAADACVLNAPVVFPCNAPYYMSGVTPVTFSRGQAVLSDGVTRIGYTSTTSNILQFTTISEPSLSDFEIFSTNDLLPTAGIAVHANNVAYFKWSNITVEEAYEGIKLLNGVGHRGRNFRLGYCSNIGFFATGVNTSCISDYVISAPIDYITVSGISGTFLPEEELRVGGVGVAQFKALRTASVLKTFVYGADIAPGAVITGAASGATATVVSTAVPYQLGAIRLFGFVESFWAFGGDVIGGKFAMTQGGASLTRFQCPAFNKFIGVFFDSSDEGVLLDNVLRTEFTNCWFSNAKVGARLLNTKGVSFNGGEVLSCREAGINVASGSTYFSAQGVTVTGNSTSAAGTFAGIEIEANTNLFDVKDCTMTDYLSFGTQAAGIRVAVGSSDNYEITGNKGFVIDGGTGVNKRVHQGTSGPIEQSYIPTVTSDGGVPSAFSVREVFYTRDAGYVDLQVRVQIATVGPASGALRIQMPFAPSRDIVLCGRDANTGKMISGVINAGATTLFVVDATGASIIAAGAFCIITSRYRV